MLGGVEAALRTHEVEVMRRALLHVARARLRVRVSIGDVGERALPAEVVLRRDLALAAVSGAERLPSRRHASECHFRRLRPSPAVLERPERS